MVQKKGAAEVAAALAQLNAAKSGTKRLDTFELKEEAAVYDEVDDAQYAQLVTKRRIEAGLSIGASLIYMTEQLLSACWHGSCCVSRLW